MSSPNTPNAGQLARYGVVFHALSDPSRLAIVHALANGPQPSYSLARTIECSPTLTSRHLRILRNAGVISADVHSPQTVYQLNYTCVLGFTECLEQAKSAHCASAC